MSLTRTCAIPVICLIIFSPISILVNLSAVTLSPQGILEARHELDGLSNIERPTDFAAFLT